MSSILVLSILLLFFQAHAQPAFSVSFLSEVEDVEREMWWIVTGKRKDSLGTPWRALQKAILDSEKLKSNQVKLSTCKRMSVVKESQPVQLWKVSSLCQGRPVWIGDLQKLSKDKWNVRLPLNAWIEHFGTGVSIFYKELSCDIGVSSKGRVLSLSCPQYARNRNAEEIVELENFRYQKGQTPLMEIKGYVKKQFEIVGRLESVVPIVGDIKIKEIKYPKKKEVESLEFSHKREPPPGEQKNGEKENSQKENNQEEINHEGSAEEAPPIEDSPPSTGR